MNAIVVSEEVRAAVAEGRPVVALESTIFTHGLPRPRNLTVALEGEQQIRDAGAVPATIAVVDGVPTVGLTTAQITTLAQTDGLAKVSVRDLPVVRAKGLSGGTTVAATSFLAHAAGISVFSTGGLGGVHHGASESFDESADMTALTRIPVIVVSAGVKSILDVAATLERFETLNIPVVGYRTTDYPGFYLSDSGFDITYAADTPAEVAAVHRAQASLGLTAAVLVANPVPADQQLDPAEHDAVVARAWAEIEAQGIHGQATTPFLLDFIQRETSQRSLDVNVAVYRNNIALGCEIAAALAGK